MHRCRWLAILFAMLPAAALALGAAPDITGQYRAERSGMVVALGTCTDGRICGRIVALGDLPATDANNPTPELRERPLCGVTVIDGLEWQNGGWRGTLYEPQNGTNYSITVAPVQDAAVRVTGYSGRPVLSRTLARPFEIWQRVISGTVPCAASTVTS